VLAPLILVGHATPRREIDGSYIATIISGATPHRDYDGLYASPSSLRWASPHRGVDGLCLATTGMSTGYASPPSFQWATPRRDVDGLCLATSISMGRDVDGLCLAASISMGFIMHLTGPSYRLCTIHRFHVGSNTSITWPDLTMALRVRGGGMLAVSCAVPTL